MITKATHVSLFVKNQDDAKKFYTEKLGFKVHTDENFSGMRWLTLNAGEQKDFELALMPAETPEEVAIVGKQGAKKPFICFQTNDCNGDYKKLSGLGVKFAEQPTQHPWGLSATFEDLYGNLLYIVQV